MHNWKVGWTAALVDNDRWMGYFPDCASLADVPLLEVIAIIAKDLSTFDVLGRIAKHTLSSVIPKGPCNV